MPDQKTPDQSGDPFPSYQQIAALAQLIR